MRTNHKRYANQLDAEARERKCGLRRGLQQRDCRHDNDPTRNLQEESKQFHENYEPL